RIVVNVTLSRKTDVCVCVAVCVCVCVCACVCVCVCLCVCYQLFCSASSYWLHDAPKPQQGSAEQLHQQRCYIQAHLPRDVRKVKGQKGQAKSRCLSNTTILECKRRERARAGRVRRERERESREG